MAYESLEPFGSLHLEQVIGTVCATVWNRQRSQGDDVLLPADFMPALAAAQRNYAPEEAIQDADPDKQAELVARALFGKSIPPKAPPPLELMH